MSEDEVCEGDLTSEQVIHVHLVGIECAKEDLQKKSANYPKAKKKKRGQLVNIPRGSHIIPLSTK